MPFPDTRLATGLTAAIGLLIVGAVLGLVLVAAKRRRGRLTKVLVDLPEGSPWADWLKAESLWARPLGGDLYEVRNSPFHARGLHFRDIVQAVPPAVGEAPMVAEVVRRGGHRTVGVLFNPEVPEAERQETLATLNRWGAFYENGDNQLFAVDVRPEGNYRAVHEQLVAWEREGKLVFDTGSAGEDTR